MTRSVSLFALACVAVGCAPADIAGNYTVAVTTTSNECEFDGWMEGASSSGIPVTITQDEGDATATVEGTTGGLLNLVVGSNRFVGDVAGNGFRADLIGDNTGRQGECAYTVTVEMDATIDGDIIEGDLEWRPVTNSHPDCGILDTCRNRQTFNGTRPPSAD